jgi:hypothetical protein
MMRVATVLALLIPAAALAQGQGHHQNHGAPMVHGKTAAPTQPGQSAFAAIQEIVGILEADSATDWSSVDIETLRQHLVDMNNVTLAANVTSDPVAGGMRFVVTGPGPVQTSIRRMVAAHAATLNRGGGWSFSAMEVDGGASLTVLVPEADLTKLRALGFIGVMTRGMHHQEHHLMIAKGAHPHP